MSATNNAVVNLPEPPFSGPLTIHVSVTIDAPIQKVWQVLTDFTKYGEWYVLYFLEIELQG